MKLLEAAKIFGDDMQHLASYRAIKTPSTTGESINPTSTVPEKDGSGMP